MWKALVPVLWIYGYGISVLFISALLWANISHPLSKLRRDRFIIGLVSLIWPVLFPIVLVLLVIYGWGLAGEFFAQFMGSWLAPEISPNIEEINQRLAETEQPTPGIQEVQ